MIKPRQYQADAIRKSVIALLKHKRALIDMATGLGKTFTAALIAKKLKAKRILFLVHNNYILDNAMNEFGALLDGTMEMAMYNGHTKEGAEEANVVFATWQTMHRHLKKWKKNHFDLIIVDEAHHTEAITWKPVVKHFTGMKLGLTATPDRTDAADIRGVFGKEVVKLTLEEAIARGWLPKIEYHVVTDLTLDPDAFANICAEIKQDRRKVSLAELNKRIFISKRDKEIASIINSYNNKAVVFCASIAHADKLAKHLKNCGTFHSGKRKGNEDHISALERDTNRKVLERLNSGELKRVTAVNAFNEGVNVPSVELVAFCRATGVVTIFRQQLGRGLRPGKDKLIVLDFVANLERIRMIKTMVNKIADLHEQYTSKAERQRENYKRGKVEVSGEGFEFTFSDEIVSLMDILSIDYYPTWQEASAAAIKLGIVSVRQYIDNYKKDPRLPSCPRQAYPDFPGWYVFLNKTKPELYTFEEIVKVCKKAKVKVWKDYIALSKQDKRVPKRPNDTYKLKHGFYELLGTVHLKNLDELKKEVAKYGINSQFTYKKIRQKLRHLPSNPNIKYKDEWISWGDLFGRPPHYTLQEASKKVSSLGFKTSTDYYQRRHEDPRLPAYPQRKYRKNWPGWDKFLRR